MPTQRSNAAAILGDRIRDARITLGLPQADIAHLAGMDVANYGKLERGQSNPTLETLVQVSTVLGTDLGALTAGLSGTDMLPPSERVFTAADFIEARGRRNR
ncbi:helix-turn-helix domain-containing protein [Leifsonia sp. NPDC102414]|uniref:helix-turn-helix domain-containing protein n=1 Tax=Leifsonia sp. NPDC102414 TaxID=3364124 RepID=UPI00382148C1